MAKLQPEIKSIAYLGVPGSYSHQAAGQYADASTELVSVRKISDVFRAVERGDASIGVVPIENSIAGRVAETYECVSTTPLSIISESFIEIEHNLAVHRSVAETSQFSLENIKTVCSHKQALMQCEEWLRDNLPNAELIEQPDTASAAKFIADGAPADTAAICSRHAVELYDLTAVAERIQNQRQNFTRFHAVSRNGEYSEVGLEKNMTSILFQTQHVPGALLKVLQVVEDAKVNMTKLETYMISGARNLPTFYADLGVSRDSENGKGLLDAIAANTASLRILGSYRASSDRGIIPGFLAL